MKLNINNSEFENLKRITSW